MTWRDVQRQRGSAETILCSNPQHCFLSASSYHNEEQCTKYCLRVDLNPVFLLLDRQTIHYSWSFTSHLANSFWLLNSCILCCAVTPQLCKHCLPVMFSEVKNACFICLPRAGNWVMVLTLGFCTQVETFAKLNFWNFWFKPLGMYCRLWSLEGTGVPFFQPDSAWHLISREDWDFQYSYVFSIS